MQPRIWLIAGPTASGKSGLALRLAQRLGAQILGADSMQLYGDLPILTAAPSPAKRASVPHHLVGVADATEAWSAGRWLRAATEVLAATAGPLVVVGGTGLYFSALTEGLADIPPVSEPLRRTVGEAYDTLGEAAFRERLFRRDPAAAERIAPGDRQRLVRAQSVLEASGTSLSDWQAATRPALAAGSWRAVALEPPRQDLYARCDARLEAMLSAGVLDEVAAFAARDLDPTLPLMKAVGLREFTAHLNGELSLEEALAAAQRETRRYAKRQTTWLRGRMSDWPRIDALDPDEQWGQVLALNPFLTP